MTNCSKLKNLMFNRFEPNSAIWADSPEDIKKMQNLLGNHSDKIIIVDPSDIHLREKILRECFSEEKSEIQKKADVKYKRPSFFRK